MFFGNLNLLLFYRSRCRCRRKGDLSNDDGDSDENGKKAMG